LIIIELYLLYRFDVILLTDNNESRPLSFLVQPSVKEAMDVLLGCITANHLFENNSCFFPLDSENSRLSSWEVVTVIAKQANLKCPNLFRNSNIRKFVSTVLKVCASTTTVPRFSFKWNQLVQFSSSMQIISFYCSMV